VIVHARPPEHRAAPPTIPSRAARLNRRHPYAGYGIAVASIAGALLLRALLDPWLGTSLPFATIYAALALTMWLAGWKPAALAAVLGFLATEFLFVEPRFSLGEPTALFVVSLLLYLTTCAIIIGMGQAREVVLFRLKGEQERLQRSERFHQAIAELAADVAWTARVDPDGTVVTDAVSEGYTRHLGYTLRDLVDAGGWIALVPPGDHEWVGGLMRRAVRGETVSGDMRMVARDGHTIWMRFVTRPVRDAAGQVVRLYGGAHDITERRAAAAALADAGEQARLARARLESVVASIGDQLFVLDRDGRYVYVNDEVVRSTGHSREELLGHSIWELFPALVGSEFERTLHDALERQRSARIELPSTPAGRWFDTHVSPSPDGVTVLATDVTERRTAGDLLRESEVRFRSFADGVPVLMWLNNETGATFANRAYREFIGVTEEEIVSGWDWSQYVYPGDRERYVAAYLDCHARRADFDAEFRFRRHDGEYRWMRSVGVPRFTDSGDFLGYTGCTFDIHDSRTAAAAVRASEQQLQAILQATPAPVYLLDTRHRLVHVNRGYEKAVGRDAKELIGRALTEIFPPDVSGPFVANNERVLSEGRPLEFEELTRNDGERQFWSVKAPMFDESGNAVGIAGFSLDITDRKRTEAALRQREARMRLLWEAAEVLLTAQQPDAMLRRLFERVAPHIGADGYLNFLVDDGGTHLRLASCAGLSDAQAESVARLEFGQALCGTVARDRKPCAATHIQSSDDPRVQIVRSFGFRAYACNPLLVGDDVLGTLSFASRSRDAFGDDELEFLQIISRYVTAAFERLRLISRLRETDTRKDEFLATLAHELRNPLAPIRNMLEVLTRFDEDEGLRRQARDTMTRQVDQLVRLVDDLLDVSRITRNRLTLRKERAVLAEIVQQAVETCRPLLDAQRHELRVVLPPEPVHLDADPVRLAQVFANLLNNACKYTPPGGHITVRADREGSDIVVCVQDDGVGIPLTALPRIFDMFSQVDGSLERAQGGLGIGLTLVRQLVEMHGGRVSASSSGPGLGSTFEVRLPASVEAPAPPVPSPVRVSTPELSNTGPRRRILVVDDYKDSAESLAIFLRFAGHDVSMAHDGIAAFEEAERVRPDVILLDIGLPGLNGYEVCKRLRAQPWGREMTILALTGWGQEDDRRKSQEAGFDDHLVKPLNYRALAEVLAGLPEGAER
jgi:PAS domain S-box-containing protein